MRAYIVFTFIFMLQYPAAYLIPNLITIAGWKQTWIICGGLNVGFGLLMLVTVKEPPKPTVLANDLPDAQVEVC
jgi:hypothetical protein